MDELLSENAFWHSTESKSKKERDSKAATPINSPLAKVECFQAFMAVVAVKAPDRVPDLLAYCALHAARQFEGNAWQLYDRNFRQQATALKLVKWAEVNTSLWTMACSQAKAASHCTLCMSLEHQTTDSDKQRTSDKGFYSQDRTSVTNMPPICKNWNFASCYSSTYRFRHICLECLSPHMVPQCSRYHPYQDQS